MCLTPLSIRDGEIFCGTAAALETRATILTRNFCAVLKILKMHLKGKTLLISRSAGFSVNFSLFCKL